MSPTVVERPTTSKGCKHVYELSRICIAMGCALFTMAIPFVLQSQSFNVKGNISTSVSPVKDAWVTFVDQSDTSKQYSSITDGNGHFELSVITDVPNASPLVPQKFELQQNFPNPFSSSTGIPYQLHKQSEMSLKVYDILGRQVRTLAAGLQTIGTYTISWDGKNDAGQALSPGVYFCQLRAGGEMQVKKMVLIGGNASITVPLRFGFSTAKKESRGAVMRKNASGVFTVKVCNISSTRPKILISEFAHVVLQQDTTLTFEVQEGIMAYSLCYEKQETIVYLGLDNYPVWSIHLNSITGTNPKTIINWPRNSNYPKWSQDGKYIAFTYEDTQGDYDLYLYDTANDSLIGLITSDTMTTSMNIWTPDGKLIYGNSNPHDSVEFMYVMNPDGSNNKRISVNPRWFYPDGFTCLRHNQGDQYKIYRSNLDRTFDELIFDCKTVGVNYVRYTDFNPYTNDLLILADPTSTLTTLLLKFNIDTKKIDTVSVADSGWIYVHFPTFSHDFIKIAVVEANYNALLRRISILENGTKTVLVEIPMRDEYGNMVHVESPIFSPDDKYLAFSRDVGSSGSVPYLYVLELQTKQLTLVDIGDSQQWNPKKTH